MTIGVIALIGWLVGFGADQTYRAINPPPVSLSNCPAVKITVEVQEDGSRIERRQCIAERIMQAKKGETNDE